MKKIIDIGKNLTYAHLSFSSPSAESTKVTFSKITKENVLQFCELTTQLKIDILHFDCEISLVSLAQMLTMCPHLEELRLIQKIDKSFLEKVQQLTPNLTTLDINSSEVTSPKIPWLVQCFPKLINFGNSAPILRSNSELFQYLKHFSCHEEEVRKAELYLRTLNVILIEGIDDRLLHTIRPYTNLLHRFIGKNLTATILKLPSAREISCRGSSTLDEIDAKVCTHIDCSNCMNLRYLFCLNATHIITSGCSSLKNLYTSKAVEVRCNGCITLKDIIVYSKECTIECGYCFSLTNLEATYAKSVDCQGCTSLTFLELPHATLINCNDCTNLNSLIANLAAKISAKNCPSLPNQTTR